MKLPKETRRYCPYCRKHTLQDISTAKQRARSSTHPLSRWGAFRTKKRSYRMGYGNLGRFSKPGAKDTKMKTKVTKRITIMYTCKVCKKMKGINSAIRSSRVQIGEKISK